MAKRNKIHIINLRETIRGLIATYYFVRDKVARGHQVLIVGTKRQAQEVAKNHAQSVEMPYVSERWLGGTLTNLSTIHLRVKRLEELEKLEAEGTISTYSKKMQSAINREKRKMFTNLDGIRSMNRLPGVLFIVDPRHDLIAVKEARRLGIPVIGMLDTEASLGRAPPGTS